MPRPVHFVGSVPLRSASAVFEAIARHLGPLAPRIPDGEQAGWLSLAREHCAANPLLEVKGDVQFEPDSDRKVLLYGLKPGAKVDDLKLGPYGYGKNAIESYRQFAELKKAGKIPATTRFQFTIPGPGTSTFYIQLPAEQLLPKAREAIAREIAEALEAIPRSELAIQIDLGMEAEHEEYLRRPDNWNQPIHTKFHWTLDQMAESAAWVANTVPNDVELGFHICSIWHHDTKGGQDNACLVDAANAVLSRVRRPVAYVHMPVIPEHTAADYEPFTKLRLPAGAKLYLGLLNLADGIEGAKRRLAIAQSLKLDVGVGMFCGLGHAPGGRMGAYRHRSVPALRRATPETLDEVLELHRQAAEA